MSRSRLKRASVHLNSAITAGCAIGSIFERLSHVPDEATRGALLELGREKAAALLDQAGEAKGLLDQATDRLPDLDPGMDIPFHLLDTEDTRALLVGLGALLPVAERIDAARGRSLPEPVGGSAGMDLAEDLAQLIARLELEIYGPAASVTGGRE